MELVSCDAFQKYPCLRCRSDKTKLEKKINKKLFKIKTSALIEEGKMVFPAIFFEYDSFFNWTFESS